MRDRILPLVEQLNEGVLFVDENFVVRYCNPSGAAVRNIDAKDIIGKSVFGCHTDKAAKKMKKVVDDLLSGKKEFVKRVVQVNGRYFDFTYQKVIDKEENTKGVVAVSRDVTQEVLLRKKYEKQRRKLHKMSITDGLTGLYNSRYFYDKLSEELIRAKRFNQNVTLLFMDMDRFKEINDSLGHKEGDKVLKAIAKIIKSSIRNKVDSAFRYGGDEFVILLPDSDSVSAVNVANRINKSIADSFNEISASIGIVCADEMTQKELIIAADKAMYKVKKAKKLIPSTSVMPKVFIKGC